MWRREMDWLLCVSDHIVELVPTWQSFPDGNRLEVRLANTPCLHPLHPPFHSSHNIPALAPRAEISSGHHAFFFGFFYRYSLGCHVVESIVGWVSQKNTIHKKYDLQTKRIREQLQF